MTPDQRKLSDSPLLPFVRVIIIIPTAFITRKRRDMIRRQWKRMAPKGSQVNDVSVMRFFVGLRGLNKKQLEGARREAAQFEDIVLVKDIRDFDDGVKGGVTSATTLKIFEAFKWAVTHYRFDYLVRQGDDAYFNLNEFLRVTPSSTETAEARQKRLALANPMVQIPLELTQWCRFYYENPVREPQLAALLRSRTHTPYCLGMGYVLTSDLVRFVAKTSVPFLMSYAEDTTVGQWFSGLHIHNIDDPRFHHLGPQPTVLYNDGKIGQSQQSPEPWAEAPCKPTDLLTHYMTESDWDLIANDGSMTCY